MDTLLLLSTLLLFSNVCASDLHHEVADLKMGGSSYTGFAGPYGLAIHGDYVAVGAMKDDLRGTTDVGSVTVFKREDASTFKRVRKLNPNDGVTRDHFGSSVAINDKYVVVGAAWQEGRKRFRRFGAVYIFDFEGKLIQKLLPKFEFYKKNVAMFGWNVAVREDHTIVVSAPWEDIVGKYASGGVYVFTQAESGRWDLKQRIPRPAQESGHFGYGLRLSGDNLIVNGGNPDNGQNVIAVNVFKQNASSGEFEYRQRIDGVVTFTDQKDDCKRGGCMDVSGGHMVVLSNPHMVSIYQDNGTEWQKVDTLAVDSIIARFTESKNVKASVRLQEGVLLIGAWWPNMDNDVESDVTDDVMFETGAVFVYTLDKESGVWEEQAVLLPEADAEMGDMFGNYIAFDGDLVLVKHAFHTQLEGSVYVFDLSKEPITTPAPPTQKTLPPTEKEVKRDPPPKEKTVVPAEPEVQQPEKQAPKASDTKMSAQDSASVKQDACFLSSLLLLAISTFLLINL